LIQDTLRLIGEISKDKSDHDWKSLKDELHKVIQSIILDECQYECYKINIMRSALIPYIGQMHGRLLLNRKRFQQIQMLLSILCHPSSKDEHPANVLKDVETLVASINAEGGWWVSEFGLKMQHALKLEWMPIMTENR
jgi:hypothetical protein